MSILKKEDVNLDSFSKAAKKVLHEYKWPGNIRELKNTIERATLLFDDIELRPEHLSFLQAEDKKFDPLEKAIIPGKIVIPDDELDIEQLELEIVRKALMKFDNNKTKTADYLRITRSALR